MKVETNKLNTIDYQQPVIQTEADTSYKYFLIIEMRDNSE